MTVATCAFCGRQQEDFKGTYLIKNDGTVVYYCSNKCRKNALKLGRDKRRLKWTSAFREVRVKQAKKQAEAAEKANSPVEKKAVKKSSKKKG